MSEGEAGAGKAHSGQFDSASVWLHIAGNDLDPDEVTGALGVPPTSAGRRGDRRPRSTGEVVLRYGYWTLALPNSTEWELADAIGTLLARLPADVAVWEALGRRHTLRLMCGVFVSGPYAGGMLPPALVRDIAARGLALGLDVVATSAVPGAEPPTPDGPT